MKNILLLSLAAGFLFACGTTATETVTEVVDDTPMTAEMERGKKIYASKCTKCHKQKVIDKYSREKWNKVLPVMVGKAELNSEETEAVTMYVHWELEH